MTLRLHSPPQWHAGSKTMIRLITVKPQRFREDAQHWFVAKQTHILTERQRKDKNNGEKIQKNYNNK